MMKGIILVLMAAATSACICLPDEKHGVDSHYFGNCYEEFKNAPRQPVYVPKDAL